ncbi:hypothetical protein Plhal304r1_c015g0054591 [Plasmopara halstedii]
MNYTKATRTKVLIKDAMGTTNATWRRYERGVFLTKSMWHAVGREMSSSYTDPRAKSITVQPG